MQLKSALPLPRFVLHPLRAVVIAIVHVYLASGHLFKLVAGEVAWTHIWKGTGAVFGAYNVCCVGITPSCKELQRTTKNYKELL